jgi:hypothetical protein
MYACAERTVPHLCLSTTAISPLHSLENGLPVAKLPMPRECFDSSSLEDNTVSAASANHDIMFKIIIWTWVFYWKLKHSYFPYFISEI